jgi:hypothetical protein
MYKKSRKIKWMMRLASVWASSLLVSIALGQSNQEKNNQDAASSARAAFAASSAPSSRTPSNHQFMLASGKIGSARMSYAALGGVDNLIVQETASGALLRFSYRVFDANKAKALNDKKATPYLIDEKTGVVLQVPQMPKVGLLRQTADPVNGAEYWMAFSNKGAVKRGNRVDVVIGNLRFNGLVVQ